VKILLHGDSFEGRLEDDGKLHWSDGSVWTRKASNLPPKSLGWQKSCGPSEVQHIDPAMWSWSGRWKWPETTLGKGPNKHGDMPKYEWTHIGDRFDGNYYYRQQVASSGPVSSRKVATACPENLQEEMAPPTNAVEEGLKQARLHHAPHPSHRPAQASSPPPSSGKAMPSPRPHSSSPHQRTSAQKRDAPNAVSRRSSQSPIRATRRSHPAPQTALSSRQQSPARAKPGLYPVLRTAARSASRVSTAKAVQSRDSSCE
jgi:hypothetical protein